MTTAKVAIQKETKLNQSAFYAASNQDLEIQALVQNAAHVIAPVWPLETFIACNPLQGFESKKFADALFEAGVAKIDKEANSALLEVNTQMIKWCSNYFDQGQSIIEMPFKDQGFYLSFKKLAPYCKVLKEHQEDLSAFIDYLPRTSEATIRFCLTRLGVPQEKQQQFLSKTLMYLSGWAGYVKWQMDWKNKQEGEVVTQLSDFLAVRLVITCMIWPQAFYEMARERHDKGVTQKLLSNLEQHEALYQQQLLKKLLPEVLESNPDSNRADAQLIFCIDVRSEPFRRAIEKLGHYETLGFAGFFGIPARIHEFKTDKAKDCCPVLLKPRYSVSEKPIVTHEEDIQRYQQGKAIITGLKNFYNQIKYNFATPFALVESLGVWCGLSMALKTLSPDLSHRLVSQFQALLVPKLDTEIAYEPCAKDEKHGISSREQLAYAETVLRLMGLTQDFAKIVIICGHGSTTENNPYASALDCGACGGNHGAMNAKLLAQILNKTETRQYLEEKGIHIPIDCTFYAALHNTTTDKVEIYSKNVKSQPYPELFHNLNLHLMEAKRMTHIERGYKLNADKGLEIRGLDWSETRPEWGLARNAAFIVGPRSMTKNIHLDGRCFLHSYDWASDAEGSLLETILTAPMVVAQWINAQYLFSTLDNVNYGSGSKITHNVVGKIGVMQGNASDLMHGLPMQSVMQADEIPYHQPQRLLTIVYAPKKTVTDIIEKQTLLKTLFFNEWVHLVVMDPNDNLAYQLSPTGQWKLIEII